MPTPNVIGYVTEFVEDRPVVHDQETNQLVPGDTRMRFKLKLKNTMGQDKVVWAVLEDQGLTQEVGDFFSAEMSAAPVVISNRTVDELASQLVADLNGEKDAHDRAIDEAQAQAKARMANLASKI